MKRAFKIPTIRKDNYFKRSVEFYAESFEYDHIMDLEIYHLTGDCVYQKFCLPCMKGNPLDIYVEANAN